MRPLMERITAGYIALFQGTPLLMQLFVVYYGLALVGLKLDAWVAVAISRSSSHRYCPGAFSGSFHPSRTASMWALSRVENTVAADSGDRNGVDGAGNVGTNVGAWASNGDRAHSHSKRDRVWLMRFVVRHHADSA